MFAQNIQSVIWVQTLVSPGGRHLNGNSDPKSGRFHWLDDEALRERHRCGRPQRTFVVYRHNEPDLPDEIDPVKKYRFLTENNGCHSYSILTTSADERCAVAQIRFFNEGGCTITVH